MVPLWASPSCDSGGQKNTGTVILNSFMGPNFITAPCSHTSPPITYVFSSCFTAILDGKQANHRFWKFLIDLEISGYLISSTVLQVGSSSHYNLIWQKKGSCCRVSVTLFLQSPGRDLLSHCHFTFQAKFDSSS